MTMKLALSVVLMVVLVAGTHLAAAVFGDWVVSIVAGFGIGWFSYDVVCCGE